MPRFAPPITNKHTHIDPTNFNITPRSLVVNDISETLIKHAKERGKPGCEEPEFKTWVHKIFEGKIVTETKCLECESVSKREESFFTLRLPVTQNSSVTACLKRFSESENMCSSDKYFCDTCNSRQEAHKRVRIQSLPEILAMELKRFEYVSCNSSHGGFELKKLMYRVSFSLELRLFNTTETTASMDQMYDLFAVVIHVGSQLNRGHYICLRRAEVVDEDGEYGWFEFDDQNVVYHKGSEQVRKYFGNTDSQMTSRLSSAETAYMLFYERRKKSGAPEKR